MKTPLVSPPAPEASGELLILPDGSILGHNLTPELAAVLSALNPADEAMALRAQPAGPLQRHHQS